MQTNEPSDSRVKTPNAVEGAAPVQQEPDTQQLKDGMRKASTNQEKIPLPGNLEVQKEAGIEHLDHRENSAGQ
ncbi:MAG: hypothetical protein EOO28_23020 [Comamonadaceae bacterium]|nr:MAG: hypothetical protein EOO28_23020 [Comamonadaceae bacterium]